MQSKYTLLLALLFFFSGKTGLCQNINTVIGGLGDNGAATAAELNRPGSVAVDKAGNIYITDYGDNIVRKVDAAGVITTYAGVEGNSAYSGDGGQAKFAAIGNPASVAIDTFGNLFICDYDHKLVRKVGSNGIISTYAGSYYLSSRGEGIPATNAYLSSPSAIAVDNSGNLYIADNGFNNVRMVNTAGIINTVAGNGTGGMGGDGFPATAAMLNQPTGVCVDRAGNIFISDEGNYRIRKVDVSGIIRTYAGNGVVGYAGDGNPATDANFNQLAGLAADAAGNVYVSDINDNEVRKINTAGIISRLAGTIVPGGFSGDGGPATSAQLLNPAAVATDASGNIYIADARNNRVRKVSAARTISTVAGCNFYSTAGYKGDGGPAVSALLSWPRGLCYDAGGDLLIADCTNNCIRMVNPSGIISTIAGNDTAGSAGDSGPAIHARLRSPIAVAADKKGNVYISDYSNSRIRKVNSSGIISTWAGTGISGFSGDGHRADSAKITTPYGIATDKYGNVYFTDYGNYCIRKIDTNQVITTIAGTGVPGYFGDGGPATDAEVRPAGIFVDKKGNLFFADNGNCRVRKIDTAGIITTVAGNGSTGISGDGGSAIFASIDKPIAVFFDKSGNLFISSSNRVRKVNTAGIITTYAGSGSGFSGDGGPAIQAGMSAVDGLVADTSGNLLIADGSYNRIREVYNAAVSISTPLDTLCAGLGATFTATVVAAPEYTPYFHWQKNGKDTGTNSNVYTSPFMKNGDVVQCYITNGPAGPSIAASNKVTIYVPSGSPYVAISYVSTSNCVGTSLTLNAVSITDGGISPVIDWYKNGIKVFTGLSYTFTPVNGDSMQCKLTSSLPCIVPDTAISSTVKFSTYIYTPAVKLYFSPAGSVCLGTPVTVTPSTTYGGSSPRYYWYKNGTYVYTGSSYSGTPLVGDMVYCELVSNQTCVTSDTASDSARFSVMAPANPTVTISVNPGDSICPGSSVTCTPVATLAGSLPYYNWFVNGTFFHTGSTCNFVPDNGAVLICHLLSNASCTVTDTAASPPVTFTYVTPTPDSVTISVTPGDTVCSGAIVTLAATPFNGGASPAFSWHRVNGAFYSTTDTVSYAPADGDIVYCTMVSSLACASPATATSNQIKFSVKQKARPTASIAVYPGTTICQGVPVVCTANGTDQGDAPIYNWFLNGNNVFTGGQYGFTPATGDQLYCTLTSNADCISPATVNSNYSVFQSATTGVTISCTPGTVNFSGTTVDFAANLGAYAGTYALQWMRNGTPIPGATAATYSANDFSVWDSVNCQVTYTGGCDTTITSNTLVIDTYHGMKLYPDPNDGNFVINGNDYNANGDAVTIRIFNAAGKLVYEKNDAFSGITFFSSISLGHQLSPGVYLLRLNYARQKSSFIFTVRN